MTHGTHKMLSWGGWGGGTLNTEKKPRKLARLCQTEVENEESVCVGGGMDPPFHTRGFPCLAAEVGDFRGDESA